MPMLDTSMQLVLDLYEHGSCGFHSLDTSCYTSMIPD